MTADAIKVRLTVTVENGTFKEWLNPAQSEIDQAAVGRYGGVQLIGSTPEVVVFGDVVTEGCIYLQNLDTTLNITYGPQSGVTMIACGCLKPGEFAWARMSPGAVLMAQNNGGSAATAKLDIRLFED